MPSGRHHFRLLSRTILTVAMSLAMVAPAAAQQAGPDDITVTGQRNQAMSKWVRAESPDFTVYGTDEEQVRRVLTKLERFRQLLGILTQTPPPEAASPLPVYLVFGTTQIDRLRRTYIAPGFFPTGYYSAAPSGWLLAADMRWDAQQARIPTYHEAWLFSEYTRHFLLQNARGAYLPAWYVDGLSLYFSTTRFDGGAVEYGQAHPDLTGMLTGLRWEPIGRIVSGDLRSGQLYSAESLLLVHYLFADPARVKAFGRFLAALRAGTSPVAAFEAAFGMTMKALQSRLWEYRYKATFVRATAKGFAIPEIDVTRLPKSADDLLLDQAAMRIGIPDPDRQQAVLRRAERAVEERPDAFAQRVLAEAQIFYGQPGKADAALDTLLAGAPADPELLYLKGMRHLSAGRRDAAAARGEYREARKWFARAYRADPDYYPALYAWAESLSTEPQFVSDNTLNVLGKAALLAPQATQIKVTAALMMMLDGRFEAAAQLLSPVTVSPRDPASLRIPALLEQARLRQRATMEALTESFRFNATWTDVNCC